MWGTNWESWVLWFFVLGWVSSDVCVYMCECGQPAIGRPSRVMIEDRYGTSYVKDVVRLVYARFLVEPSWGTGCRWH
jgi:hypothetical protein